VPMDFESWYSTAYPAVFGAVRLAIGDRDAASDACAEAFLGAFAEWDRVAAMRSPQGWVFTVALNYGRKEWRRGRRRGRPLRPDDLQVAATGPLDPAVVEALDRLTARQRTVLIGRALLDMTPAELADLLGVREGTVWATYNAAKKRAADHIEESRTSTGA